MTTRRTPLRKAFDEARVVALGVILLVVTYQVYSDARVPWVRRPPGTGDTVSLGELLDTAASLPADTVSVVDTSMAGLDTAAPPSDTAAPARRDTAAVTPRDTAARTAPSTPIAPKEIGTATARQIYDRKAAVWFDARRPDDFAQGHIPGAHNVYAPDFQDHINEILAMNIPRDQLVVVYCSGGPCELSHELAANLQMLGFKRVTVYTGGTEEWTAGNNPFTKGE